MKINKQIVTTEEIDANFTGITLLSKEEYLNNKDIIPPVNTCWWLRSPDHTPLRAAYVFIDGSLIYYDVNVGFCVRPALRIWNPHSSNLSRGDRFEFAGYIWTVLSDDLALCNNVVGHTCFRKNWRAKDASDFDKSNIKKWLYNWAENNGIEFMTQTFSPD